MPISDGWTSAIGPRRPFLLGGGLAVAVLFALIFAGIDVVPVSPATLQPSTSDIAAVTGPSTVLVAVSAPSYPYGVVDPVTEVAEIAAQRVTRCHVDACFSGFVLPYLWRSVTTGAWPWHRPQWMPCAGPPLPCPL